MARHTYSAAIAGLGATLLAEENRQLFGTHRRVVRKEISLVTGRGEATLGYSGSTRTLRSAICATHDSVQNTVQIE